MSSGSLLEIRLAGFVDTLCMTTILVGHRTSNSQVAGLSPARAPPCSGLEQASLHVCASVTKQYHLVPKNNDALWLGR